jgi:microcystin-dependent protein
MSSPYIGEIRMFAGNFAPDGWAFCDGQLLPISDHQVLFSLISTTYGGDGVTTFALPDLRGRIPIHQGTGPGLQTYRLGQSGGAEQVTLTPDEMPAHAHPAMADATPADAAGPTGAVWAGGNGTPLYARGAPVVPLNTGALAQAGGSQPHTNMQPFLCVSFIISLFGVVPQPL